MRQTDILRERLFRNEIQIGALTGGLSGIIAVDVTAPGSGYASAPTVTIAAPGAGVQATAVAVLSSGAVSKVIVTNPGSGYTTVPAVTFGSGAATAVARVAPVTLDAIPTAGLHVGVVVGVYLSGALSFYRLTSGTDAESSPDVIRPDDYAASTNEKVWKVQQLAAGTGPLNKLDATADPGVGDDSADGYSVGSLWVNVTDDDAFICLDSSSGAAVWAQIDGGGSSGPLGKYDATAAPTANDDTGDGYSVGSIWCDVTADKAYVCLDASSGAAVWTEITQAGGTGGADLAEVMAFA